MSVRRFGVEPDEIGELRRIRTALDVLIGDTFTSRNEPATGSVPTSKLYELAQLAKRMVKFRDLRGKNFDPSLFADPAWDILLEIFISDALQQRISVTAATLGAKVPSTTGLRWLQLLEKGGLVVRRADPLDSRRVHVSLSEAAFTKMRLLLEHPMAILS